MDTGDLFGVTGIDRPDARMGVRAAQDFTVQHAWQLNVSPVTGLARYFLGPIVTNGPFTDNVILLVR